MSPAVVPGRNAGFTLLELLVAAAIGATVFLGIASLYSVVRTSLDHSGSQAALQRQGTLALEAIAHQARRGAVVAATCTPGAPAGTTGRVLEILVPDTTPPTLPDAGRYCYYAGTGTNGALAGALCQRFTPAGGLPGSCRDLLAGPQAGLVRSTGQSGVSLLAQPSPPDPRCPRHTDTPGTPISSGQSCLALTVLSPDTADVAFALTDGLNVMAFSSSLTLRN